MPRLYPSVGQSRTGMLANNFNGLCEQWLTSRFDCSALSLIAMGSTSLEEWIRLAVELLGMAD